MAEDRHRLRARTTTGLLLATAVCSTVLAGCTSSSGDPNAHLAGISSESPGVTSDPAQSSSPSLDPSAQASAEAQAKLDATIAANKSAQLPGGGRAILTDSEDPTSTTVTKMYVALYGHPSGPALGLLGEQGTDATIQRANEYAARYQPYTKRTVIPALEIIATVAAADAGADGDYSRETKDSELRPLVDAAEEAGVYVVLDLQSGRSDFLKQAKHYASLLKEPHVGLALDPEWRLKANEKPLRQIGSVNVSEINKVSAWLDDLTSSLGLPQKMLLLHQFRTSMIRNREDLDTDHPNLSFIIQMDGQGGQGAKQDTWAALRVDKPAGVHFGWKNFIDEDTPMLTPGQTMTQVKPKPVWVSYQ